MKYLVPMIPKNQDERMGVSELVECDIRRDNYLVEIIRDGYHTKRFIDTEFDWKIYIGYIKEIKN